MKKWDKGDELFITFKHFLEVSINKDFFFIVKQIQHLKKTVIQVICLSNFLRRETGFFQNPYSSRVLGTEL